MCVTCPNLLKRGIQMGDMKSLGRTLPCHIGPIQWASACPHLPLISHHLQRKRFQFMCQEHASETWATNLSETHRLQRNDQALIRWMCRVPSKDQVSSQDPLERMQLDDLAKVLRTCRLSWHCYIERSDGWRKSRNSNPTGSRGHGQLRKPGQKWSTWTS